MKDTILVTGGFGFIGSNFVHMLFDMGYDGDIVIIDKMTYAADTKNISGDILRKVNVCCVDIADAVSVRAMFRLYQPTLVVNFAAESHVDRSIASSAEFVRSNVVGVQVLLDAAREYGVKRFLQVGTDEVFGDLVVSDSPSKEGDMLRPSSPYSASKAAADLLVLSYVRTHGMDAVISRCSNNYGARQYPEKLIPLAINKLLTGGKVPVYGKGENVRDWIHVSDHCKGIWAALTKGRKGEIYNFGGGNQTSNITLVKQLVKLTGRKEADAIEYVTDRAGHDFRYDIDFSKAKSEFYWSPQIELWRGMAETVEWYKELWKDKVVK